MTIEQLISKYNIFLPANKPGMIGIGWKPTKADMDEIINKKAEIIAALEAKKAEEQARENAREAKINTISGLKEIEELEREWERYDDAFARMMETGSSRMSVKMPAIQIKDLLEQYPRAAAYRKALEWSYASSLDKACAGKKALERIIEGEDYKAVLEDMEKEWTEAVESHMWD